MTHARSCRTLLTGGALLLVAACGGDTTSPTVDETALFTTAITDTTISITWNRARDNRDEVSALRYKIYLSAPNPAYGSFNSVDEVEAGTLLQTLTDANTATINTDIVAGNAYYINVIVLDEKGNRTAYQPLGEFFHTGQIAYYPFHGDSNDVTASANHLVVATALALPTLSTDRFGHADSAYLFNPATPQCLQSTANVDIVGNASRTVSLWVRSNNTPAGVTRIPLAWGPGTANGSNFGLQETGVGNNWIAWLWGSASVSTATPVSELWEHWVIAYNSANDRVYTYKNGAVVNNGSAPTVVANTVNSLLYVGCGMEANVLSYPYQGRIDDVRIFNQLLSNGDVANLYAVTQP